MLGRWLVGGLYYPIVIIVISQELGIPFSTRIQWNQSQGFFVATAQIVDARRDNCQVGWTVQSKFGSCELPKPLGFHRLGWFVLSNLRTLGFFFLSKWRLQLRVALLFFEGFSWLRSVKLLDIFKLKKVGTIVATWGSFFYSRLSGADLTVDGLTQVGLKKSTPKTIWSSFSLWQLQFWGVIIFRPNILLVIQLYAYTVAQLYSCTVIQAYIKYHQTIFPLYPHDIQFTSIYQLFWCVPGYHSAMDYLFVRSCFSVTP